MDRSRFHPLIKIKSATSIARDNTGSILGQEIPMTARLFCIAALLMLPLVASADQPPGGEAIFKAKCQACHALGQVQGLLQPKPAADRPAYLAKFLKTHPAKLDESEKESVIAFLSRP